MTRLLTTGYETGDVAEVGASTTGTNGIVAVVNTSPVPRAGSYCLKCLANGATLANATKGLSLGGPKTEVWIRMAIYVHPPASEFVMASLADSAAANVACLTYNSADGLLRLRQGGLPSGTLLGAASAAMTADAWHVVEWRHQMTSSSAGVSELWLDGTRVVNFSGDNSQSATLLNVQTLTLGITVATIGAGIYVAYDDIAINDTTGSVNNARAGDGRVILLMPSGVGSSTQLVRGGTDTGANYSQVNELPPSMTQYVASATVGERDLYQMADIGVAVTSINVVEALVYGQNGDAGPGQIAATIKSGSTTSEATAVTLGTGTGYIASRWETDPNTGAAWTVAGINAAEAGVTIK